METKKYIYYAIFANNKDGISIEFPGLPGCISCGFSYEHALEMAKEALELYLDGMRDDEIPKAIDLMKIKVINKNERIIPIEAVLLHENSYIRMIK